MFGPEGIPLGVQWSIVAGAISTAGLLSMAAFGDWGKRNSSYFSAFAIGVLLVAILFHVIPESISYLPDAWKWMAGGFLGMSAIGFGLRHLSLNRGNGHGIAIGYASVIALGFHSFVDGLIYGATFCEDPFTGQVTTAGLLLHEFPEGVIAYFLARDSGFNNVRAMIWAFIAASLTTVGGAGVASLWVETVEKAPFGQMLGLTAGGLAYIIAFHLRPHASLTPKNRGYLVASAGVVVALAAVVFRHM